MKRIVLLGLFWGSLYSSHDEILKKILSCQQVFYSQEIDKALIKLSFSHCRGSFLTAERYLLTEYPQLKEKLAWVKLANLPTPVFKMKNLGSFLNHDQLYIKDDGQTDQNIGGNKLRKLELVLADAVHQGAQEICAFGCIGSNLVTEACYCAKKLGLKSYAFLKSEPNSTAVRNNLLLNNSFDTQMFYYPDEETRKIGALSEIIQHQLYTGRLMYPVSTGASCSLGTIGYINAAFELKEQINQGLIPEPDYIYIPVGSVGSIAGLAMGFQLLKMKTHVVGIGADNEDDYYGIFLNLVEKTSTLLHSMDESFPQLSGADLSVTFNYDFVGKGYAYFSPEGTEAIKLFQQYENILLDGVYTGKCAAALIKHLAINADFQNKTVLFWNTFGIYEQASNIQDFQKLPKPFYQFFTEQLKQ
jgi:D-cysteine desulfhydrase